VQYLGGMGRKDWMHEAGKGNERILRLRSVRIYLSGLLCCSVL
jgi:hypothetical protein